jgi:hypothetical protein
MVETEDFRSRYEGDGSNDSFAFGFYVTNKDQVRVVKTGTDGIDLADLVVDVDYTVGGVSDEDSASWLITYPISGAELADNEFLTIVPNYDILQETPFRTQGTFFPKTHENAFDYLTRICQMLQEQLDRSVKISVGSADSADDILAGLDEDVAAAAASASSASTSASTATTQAGNASASAVSAAASAALVDSFDKNQVATASGTDTYTAGLTPALSSYIAKQQFVIKFTNANTGAATLNIDSLGAKTIQKNGAALIAGDIPALSTIALIYDGTYLAIVGSASAGGGSSSFLQTQVFS